MSTLYHSRLMSRVCLSTSNDFQADHEDQPQIVNTLELHTWGGALLKPEEEIWPS